MEGGEREPSRLRTGGKLDENHFAVSWGGLCAGSGISGAGWMIAGDSLTRCDGARFQARGSCPGTKEISKEGIWCLVEGAVGKIPGKGQEGWAVH